MIYSDPSGHSAVLIGLIVGAIVGAGIGFGNTVYIDYQDDREIFNGSVKWYDYLGATILGGAVGAFAAKEFTFGAGAYIANSGELVVSARITITGAQILALLICLLKVVYLVISTKISNGRKK